MKLPKARKRFQFFWLVPLKDLPRSTRPAFCLVWEPSNSIRWTHGLKKTSKYLFTQRTHIRSIQPQAKIPHTDRCFDYNFQRVDILQSSRHIRIEINGIEIANTRAPRLLFETDLPVRAYIPKTDCRMDLWTPSTHMTACPYKVRIYRTFLAVAPNATGVLP